MMSSKIVLVRPSSIQHSLASQTKLGEQYVDLADTADEDMVKALKEVPKEVAAKRSPTQSQSGSHHPKPIAMTPRRALLCLLIYLYDQCIAIYFSLLGLIRHNIYLLFISNILYSNFFLQIFGIDCHLGLCILCSKQSAVYRRCIGIARMSSEGELEDDPNLSNLSEDEYEAMRQSRRKRYVISIGFYLHFMSYQHRHILLGLMI